MIHPDIEPHLDAICEVLAKLEGPEQAVCTLGIIATLTVGQDAETVRDLCKAAVGLHAAFEADMARKARSS